LAAPILWLLTFGDLVWGKNWSDQHHPYWIAALIGIAVIVCVRYGRSCTKRNAYWFWCYIIPLYLLLAGIAAEFLDAMSLDESQRRAYSGEDD